tara:strand:- start:1688 stop:2251 length:564 start_codon:yes stop_codon:yes gene_type:complete
VPIRVACDIFKYFEIETDPFSLFFEVSGRVRLCRLLCVVVRRFQMPTHHGRDLFFERNKMTVLKSRLFFEYVIIWFPRTGMVSVFFLFFLCVVAPKKFTTRRERESSTHKKKNQSRFCAKETHESSSSSSSVRLDDARWRRRRGEVSESSDENNEATRTARLFFEMARDDDDDDEWRYVSNASTRRT